MSAAFGQPDALLMEKLWRTHTVYTYGPLSLPTGVSQVFSAENYNPESSPEWRAELVGLWVTQNAGVQVSWTADGVNYNAGLSQGYTDAAPTGVRRMDVSVIQAVRQLIMTVNNTSGAAIPNFQLNYEIVMHKLTVADKILYGAALTPDDELVLAYLGGGTSATDAVAVQRGRSIVANLVDRGTSPIPWVAQYERTLRNRLVGDHEAGGLYHVTAGTWTAGVKFATATPRPGEFLMLEEVSTPAATAFTLFVDRDQDLGLLTLNGAAFAQADSDPWRPMVPATSQLAFRAFAATQTAGIPVALKIVRYKTSNIWKVRFGQAKTPTSVPGDTWAKTLAGLN